MSGRKLYRLGLALTLCACVALPASADRVRPVLANGATGLAVAPGQQLRGTAGQAITGRAATPGAQGSFGFWVVSAQAVTGVEPLEPRDLEMGIAHPNPTRGQVRFALSLPRAGAVRMRVHDVSGRRVGEDLAQVLPAGQQALVWNAPPGLAGTLFATVSLDGRVLGSRRFTLLR